MKNEKLSKQDVVVGLRKLRGWSLVKGSLHRTFKFKDFTHAFGFMKRVAVAADRMDHHPDWSNEYNKVTINLSTHSAGGLTENDFALADKIQKISGKQPVLRTALWSAKTGSMHSDRIALPTKNRRL